MKKYIVAIGVLLALSGCIDKRKKIKEPEELKMNYPTELKDCKSFRVYTENSYFVIITRCPLSQTMTAYGNKGGVNTTIEVDTNIK